MKHVRLFWSEMNKQYFSDDKFICSQCNYDLKKLMFMVITWAKKRSHTKTYCKKCYGSLRPVRETTEHNMVLLPDSLPIDAIAIFFKVPGFSNINGLDLFRAADMDIRSEETLDKTNQCHNPNFMKDPQFKPYDKSLHLEKDELLSIEGACIHLDIIAKSKPLLTNKEKKMLENKRRKKPCNK